MIVLLMAVMPMIAFFQTAVGNEIETLVKAGQLDLANRLLHRMDAVTEKSWHSPNLMLWYHMPFFFESSWCVQTDLFSAHPETFGHLRRPCDRTSTMRGGNEINTVEPFIPATNKVAEDIESLLPQYSDQTVAMRDLHHGMAGDQSWYTLRSGRVLALFRRLDLSEDTRKKVVEDFERKINGRAGEHVAAMFRSRGVAPDKAEEEGQAAAEKAASTEHESLNSAERDALQYIESAKNHARLLKNGGQWLVVISRLPILFPSVFDTVDPIQPFPKNTAELLLDEENATRASFPGPPPDGQLPVPLRRIPIVLALFAAMAALVWAIRFIARRIFLYDLREPDWLSARPLRPPFSDHLFVVSGEEQIETLIDVGECCRIRFREFLYPNRRPDIVEHIGAAGSRPHILFEDFGYRMGDAEFTRWKFDLLDSLVQLGDRTIIVISPISPTLLFTAMGNVDDAQRERWAGILRSFVWIDNNRNLALPVVDMMVEAPAAARPFKRAADDVGRMFRRCIFAVFYWFRQFTAERRQRRDRADNLRWLRRETRASALLRQFRPQLQALEGGREQMIDELCERTDKYYDALWQMCSAQERLVLFQVAQYGVVNASNRRVIRRLLTRGLLTREPELRLFNDTFRIFVCSRDEEVRKQREVDPSTATTWDQLRIPLFIGLLVIAGVFLGTQRELANASSAILTALATGLPVMVKLIGTFTDRRLAAAQR